MRHLVDTDNSSYWHSIRQSNNVGYNASMWVGFYCEQYVVMDKGMVVNNQRQKEQADADYPSYSRSASVRASYLLGNEALEAITLN